MASLKQSWIKSEACWKKLSMGTFPPERQKKSNVSVVLALRSSGWITEHFTAGQGEVSEVLCCQSVWHKRWTQSTSSLSMLCLQELLCTLSSLTHYSPNVFHIILHLFNQLLTGWWALDCWTLKSLLPWQFSSVQQMVLMMHSYMVWKQNSGMCVTVDFGF